MGLSEHEQQLLDEMERRLYQSEADVMQTPTGPRAQFNLRFVVLGVVLGIAGIGAMVAGVAAQLLWVGIIGFAMMLAGVLVATTQSKTVVVEDPVLAAARAGSAKRSAPRESFSDKMNRRWDERMDGDR